MRAVFLDRYALNPGDLDTTRTVTLCDEVDFYDRTETFEDTVKRIGNAEIVVTNKAPITREVLEACPNIKYVTVTATGYNIIDLDACRDHGVIASKAIHLQTPEERAKTTPVKNMYIDIGARDAEDAKKYVSVGDYAF